MPAIVAKIISGGQAGVDRAALDAARELGLPCGGWCPKGRPAEDGVIAFHYSLQETPSTEYPQRTQWNVRDSDGTLILAIGPLSNGTAFTLDVATRLNKPYLVLDLADQPDIAPSRPRRCLTRPTPRLPRRSPFPWTRPFPMAPARPRRVTIGIVHRWIKAHGISVLNVAGPRESTCPGIYARAKQFLRAVLAEDPGATS